MLAESSGMRREQLNEQRERRSVIAVPGRRYRHAGSSYLRVQQSVGTGLDPNERWQTVAQCDPVGRKKRAADTAFTASLESLWDHTKDTSLSWCDVVLE